MKVFLTGADGYIGSVLGPQLLAAGFDVVGLDTGYYREGWLYNETRPGVRFPQVITRDLRQIEPADLEGCDAVVHLAELSNDPLGENNPKVTFRINHEGSVRLAQLAREAGARRFVYTSSCSVYGAGTEDTVNETSATAPQTAYAECKILSSAICSRWPATISCRCSCATRPPMAPRHACVSTSCSTTWPVTHGRAARSR